MRYEQRYNVLSGFDFSVLDDPDFKEDAVREDIITPILRGLGYSNAPPHKIIRSRKLVHPFVSIGSATKKISVVPDYLLEVNGRFAWTLEAKAPTERILNTMHVEQAYSYAIHSEIRVPYFALCNGLQFILYHISAREPLIDCDLRAIPSYWDNLVALLGPARVLDYDYKLKKDFGLHLKRLGFDEFEHLVFPNLPISFVGKLDDNHYMIGSGLEIAGEAYVATFGFDTRVLEQLNGRIPVNAMEILRAPISDSLSLVQFADAVYRVDVDCRVGDKLAENEDEIFLPLWVNRIVG